MMKDSESGAKLMKIRKRSNTLWQSNGLLKRTAACADVCTPWRRWRNQRLKRREQLWLLVVVFAVCNLCAIAVFINYIFAL